MKRFIIYGAIPLLAASCGGDGDFDATGTFEATEIVVSAEAAGRILRFDAEEGDVLRAGRQVGAIDTVQLYLQKLQLERQRASVRSGRPDIGKQAASLREQIAKLLLGAFAGLGVEGDEAIRLAAEEIFARRDGQSPGGGRRAGGLDF